MYNPPVALAQFQHPTVAQFTHICDICHKGFDSGQALGGHKSMHFRKSRSISSYDSEETNTHPQLYSSNAVEELSGLMMLADLCEMEQQVSNSKRRKQLLNNAADQLEYNCNNEIDVFRCKLCDKTFTSYQALGGHTTSHNRPEINSADHGHDNDPVVNTYSCSDCDKTFSSHQALGGHKSSHKKNKNNNNMDRDRSNSSDTSSGSAEENKGGPQMLYQTVPHQCKECGKIFPTGQALGGHMRKHYEAPAKPSQLSQRSSDRRYLEINLNETPSMEDEDEIYEPSLLLKLY